MTTATPRRFPLQALPLAAALLLTLAPGARADAAPATLNLSAASEEVRPGQSLTLAIDLTVPDGWHTYWVNPGESGMAPDFRWTLPPGITLSAIHYPAPQRFDDGISVTLGYEKRVRLLAEFQADPTLAGDTFTLSLKATWMICRELCLPVESTAQVTLPRGGPAEPPAIRPDVAEARRRLPRPAEGWTIAVSRSSDSLRVRLAPGPGVSIPAEAWPRAWLFPLRRGAASLNTPPAWSGDTHPTWTATLAAGLGAPAAGEPFEALLVFPDLPLPTWKIQAVLPGSP